MFKFMFTIVFPFKSKTTNRIIQLSMTTFINNFSSSLCQHKIQMSIYPQYVLESCHYILKTTIHLIPAKINPYLRSTKLAVTMFFFCILSAAEKIMSSINKGFGKCSPQSFSVGHELSEFHTREFKFFQNCKYLAVAFSN